MTRMIKRMLIFAACIAAPSLCKAQANCNAVCQDPWGPTQVKTTTILQPPSQCTVNIYYQVRSTCAPFEFQVLKIEVVGSCSAPVLAIISGSVRNLLEGPTAGFPVLAPGECRLNVQGSFVMCWHEVNIFGLRVAIPCPETNCCYAAYKICGTNNGINTVQLISGPDSDQPCQTPGCDPMCGALALPY